MIYAQQIRQKAGCAIPQSFLKKNGNTKQNKKNHEYLNLLKLNSQTYDPL